jgi:phage I-like protein
MAGDDQAFEMPDVAQGGPVPSAGRIIALEGPEHFDRLGKLVLYGLYEPTERARRLIRSGEYRYISPAIAWGAKNKKTGKDQGTTLTSVALTNKPFLGELGQIRLSDPAFVSVEAEGEETPMELKSGHRQFLRLVEERNRQLGNYLQALTEVARERPDLANLYREAVLAGETGIEPAETGTVRVSKPIQTPAVKEFLTLVEARRKEKKCGYAEALTEIGRERRDLAEKYLLEARG